MEGKISQEQQPIRAAIYARVSSEQQTQQSTIDSQVEALRERVRADGLTLDDDLCFIDDGYSGSTLVRPGLERLRDVAWAGGFHRLYVHSPDRLARKYAWQVLLVEEFQHNGMELVFLNRTIGVSPEEDLLLQMQGMIAEYERTKIMERSRRGKRHAARRGLVSVLCCAPYGYRYLPAPPALAFRTGNALLVKSTADFTQRYAVIADPLENLFDHVIKSVQTERGNGRLRPARSVAVPE